jgi:hypothetical protein
MPCEEPQVVSQILLREAEQLLVDGVDGESVSLIQVIVSFRNSSGLCYRLPAKNILGG